MLKELQLANFKSFAAGADPIPFAPVTILVGANASGKSNVFDAIRFLQGIGMGLSIAEILTGKWEGGREVQPGVRGGAEEICRVGSKTFTVKTIVENVRKVQVIDIEEAKRTPGDWTTNILQQKGKMVDVGGRFEHRMTCRAKPNPTIESESCHVDDRLIDEFPPGAWLESYDPAYSILTQPSQTYSSEVSDNLLRDSTGKTLNQMTDSQTCAVLLRGRYMDSRFLDVRPWEMKGYVPLATPELGAYGENLSAIVYRICEQPDQKEMYLGWLTSLCAPEVTDIDFIKTDDGDVRVRLVEGNGGEKRISARSLSDGTLRFMGYLAAMFSAPEGSLFLIEEIETGLHPTRIHLLIELFEQFAESRNLQIIATTHSSQVLLSLSEQALRDAVLFARTPDSSGTVTRRLGDLPDFEEVTQQAHIDQLFTTGWMEQSV